MTNGGNKKRKGLGITATDKKVWSAITKTVTPLKNSPSNPMVGSMGDFDDDYEKAPKIKQSSSDNRYQGFENTVGRVLKNIGESNPNFSPQVTLNLSDDLTHGDVTQMHKSQGKRFIRGQIPIEARLDLHGMTQDKAHARLNQFIVSSYNKGFRKVIVVTGKGLGILQTAVPKWLNDNDLRAYILSFSYAQPQDGGDGALYVLLRRNRKKDF